MGQPVLWQTLVRNAWWVWSVRSASRQDQLRVEREARVELWSSPLVDNYVIHVNSNWRHLHADDGLTLGSMQSLAQDRCAVGQCGKKYAQLTRPGWTGVARPEVQYWKKYAQLTRAGWASVGKCGLGQSTAGNCYTRSPVNISAYWGSSIAQGRGGVLSRIYDDGFLPLQLTAWRSRRYGGRERFSPFSCWKAFAWDQRQNWQAPGQVWCAPKLILEIEHQDICTDELPWVQPNSTLWSTHKSSPIQQFRL